jgi:hypothetical protein
VFGGFVFVVVFCHALMPRVGVWFLFCLSGFSDWILPALCGGFCLESLILAQDERWRRA